jgi:hypothetical protein
VKEIGINTEVGGKTYNDVIMLEAESKIYMNGNMISTNFFTQYYYAGSGIDFDYFIDGGCACAAELCGEIEKAKFATLLLYSTL